MSIIKPQNILSIQSRDEFRQWLMTHHATEKECWVKVKRGRPMDDGTFWYIDAVEEAMCFGWIDSTLKRLDGEAYQRFAPRTKGSLWSELNKERCRRMDRLGRMTDAGRAVLPDMSPGGFTIDKEILSALQQDPIVWRNFQDFPTLIPPACTSGNARKRCACRKPPGLRMFQEWLSYRDFPSRRRHTWSARPVRYAGDFAHLCRIFYIFIEELGQTSIFDRRTMPSAAISSLAHMPGCLDGCVSFFVPPHDSSPNRSNAVNRFRVISIIVFSHCKDTATQGDVG